MGYSIDPISADCYEGTTCLINKFGIKDEKKLSQMETLITTAKCQELEISPIVGDFYCRTNMLHPFREGNGRTQRVFLTQLIRHSGHNINFSTIDTDELMIATIQSANGIVDYLRNLFKESIS